MFKIHSLRARVIAMVVGGPVLLGLGMAMLQTVNQRALLRDTETAMRQEMRQNLAAITKGIHDLVATQDQLLRVKLQGDLAVARDQLAAAGGVSLDPETVTWEAVNQFTRESSEVVLPKMLIGGTWTGQNREMDIPSAVVDRTMELVGGTCTLFQRVNQKGDMLRVSTNVKTQEGRRAIGTYIPAVNPDGSPNPVIASVLRGETYVGRAYVVNAWYVTAYEPIRDASGEVIGVLYVGVPQEASPAMRQAILDIGIGDTGYAFVLGGTGDQKHRTIIHGPMGTGKDLTESRDSDGNYFIQDLVARAVKTEGGRSDFISYDWKNPDESAPRRKTTAVTYYSPWEWVIGAGSYDEELLTGLEFLRGSLQKMQLIGIGLTVLILLLVGFLGVLFSSRTTSRIQRIVAGLSEVSAEVGAASGHMSAASCSLAEGSGQQAASIEESSSSLEELAAMVRQNAENAHQADGLMEEAKQVVTTANASMEQLTTSMGEISGASEETSKIIKTIDEIAFQTNLLALNAAVEAARAGEAGAGFAVVAEEVRNLAMRAAEAARNTAALIEKTIEKVNDGSELVSRTNLAFRQVAESSSKVASLVGDINAGSEEQARGIEQINLAVNDISKVTQQSAASAEESASATEELSAQVRQMQTMVDDLAALVSGRAGGVEEDSSQSPAGGPGGHGMGKPLQLPPTR